jgi:hypothetical protein
MGRIGAFAAAGRQGTKEAPFAAARGRARIEPFQLGEGE